MSKNTYQNFSITAQKTLKALIARRIGVDKSIIELWQCSYIEYSECVGAWHSVQGAIYIKNATLEFTVDALVSRSRTTNYCNFKILEVEVKPVESVKNEERMRDHV